MCQPRSQRWLRTTKQHRQQPTLHLPLRKQHRQQHQPQEREPEPAREPRRVPERAPVPALPSCRKRQALPPQSG
jgi:hypothetical protein